MASEIRALTKNSIDANSTITSSHGGTTANIWDRDLGTEWATINAGSDQTEAWIEIIFKNSSGVETEFAINFVGMIGNNFKDFTLQRWHTINAAYVDITTQTSNTDRNLCIVFNYTKTSRIRIKIRATIDPNREKKLCELAIARQRFTISSDPIVYDLTFQNKVRKVELGDGSTHQAFTRFTTNRNQRYRAKVSWRFLTRQDYDNLIALKNEGIPFLWYPEYKQVGKEIVYVNWINPFTAKYSDLFKGAGYTIEMELEEV